MDNKQKRYNELAEKWLNGALSPEEEKEYNEWYDADRGEIEVDPLVAASPDQLRGRIFEKVKDAVGIEGGPFPSSKRVIYMRWATAAAAVVLIFVSFNYFQRSRGGGAPIDQAVTANTGTQHDVLPGKSKAILTLSNGKEITLDDSSSGVLAAEGGAKVVKSADGSVAYQKTGAEGAGLALNNTMTIPPGGEYQLTLPDGTKVWLNAASSITFPTSFTGKERKVTISGEAYFEVAASAAHPFVVSVNGMDVTVLGTHFNINAYHDEGSIRTTLLEGSVRVTNTQTGQANQIVPGQQSMLEPTGDMSVREVNTDEVIAWKNGLFQFNKTDVYTMMRQISRWYNIEVKFEGVPTKEQFSGTIPRNITLSELLTVLKTVKVKFVMEGNKLTVMPS